MGVRLPLSIISVRDSPYVYFTYNFYRAADLQGFTVVTITS